MSIPYLIQQVLNNPGQITECAGSITQYSNVFYIGRGINYPAALEGALKSRRLAIYMPKDMQQVN
jgi:glucosamine--fructose-6-phosphate aminotransferase (isomerizing)